MRGTTVVVGLLLCSAVGISPAEETMGKGAPRAEKMGWKLGCQAYSFNRFTFYEAIDKVHSLGLRWIEAYPGQSLSPEHPDIRFDHNAPDNVRQEVKSKLKEAHDVPWGTGAGDIPAWLAEVKRQGIQPVFSVEYEHNWENSLPEIAESVVNFDRIAADLQMK
jgi:sugar phosphate isomerase/epimerase